MSQHRTSFITFLLSDESPPGPTHLRWWLLLFVFLLLLVFNLVVLFAVMAIAVGGPLLLHVYGHPWLATCAAALAAWAWLRFYPAPSRGFLNGCVCVGGGMYLVGSFIFHLACAIWAAFH